MKCVYYGTDKQSKDCWNEWTEKSKYPPPVGLSHGICQPCSKQEGLNKIIEKKHESESLELKNKDIQKELKP